MHLATNILLKHVSGGSSSRQAAGHVKVMPTCQFDSFALSAPGKGRSEAAHDGEANLDVPTDAAAGHAQFLKAAYTDGPDEKD